MKKILLLLIILITFGCKKDIPNLYTSVEGNVTDYYSKQPISCHSILIIESTDFCFFECEDIILDTAFSDTDGYYFYDFYNDSSRTYTVFA
ncbi:MAG: hypothetical protein K9H26_19190, partial [Prolixibacteraceae bacterium]|nr:hypothetical protein [Prolixibacteraceae bacterium]